MIGFLSDLLFCSYDNGWTLNFDIKLLRTEKKSVNRYIFFSLSSFLTCSSLHQGRFGICHRRRTPGNTHLCINMSSHALKGLSPNLWMWKPIRVLGLLWLLEDSSVAPVALLFHLVEGVISIKCIRRSLLVEVVVVSNKIFVLMSCWSTTRYIKNGHEFKSDYIDRWCQSWQLFQRWQI